MIGINLLVNVVSAADLVCRAGFGSKRKSHTGFVIKDYEDVYSMVPGSGFDLHESGEINRNWRSEISSPLRKKSQPRFSAIQCDRLFKFDLYDDGRGNYKYFMIKRDVDISLFGEGGEQKVLKLHGKCELQMDGKAIDPETDKAKELFGVLYSK
jgi:hypothetical protein